MKLSPGRACALLVNVALIALPMLPASSQLVMAGPARPLQPAPPGNYQLRTIDTRPGVGVRLLMSMPATTPKLTLLLFPGGDGAGQFSESDGIIRLGDNFVVRTLPDFTRQGLASVIVDVPSDRLQGMTLAFRTSPEHAQDVQKVVAFLAGQGLQPIAFVGFSAATISVAYLGTVLQDERVRALVLTGSSGRLAQLPLRQITMPVLIVHHRNDGCSGTALADAQRLPGLLSGSPRVHFVEVRGGTPHAGAGPCAALHYHGFPGMEPQVVKVITGWLSGETVPARLGE